MEITKENKSRSLGSAGGWKARIARSTRAYHEYLPLRGGTYGESDYTGTRIWRSFEMGDLASIVALETRLSVRPVCLILLFWAIHCEAVRVVDGSLLCAGRVPTS